MHWLQRVVEILEADTNDLRELARLAGGDPRTFYIGVSMSGADLRGQDLRGMQFTKLDESAIVDETTLLDVEVDFRKSSTRLSKRNQHNSWIEALSRGDLAVTEGDLSMARKAFEDSLAIAKRLAARDPRNNEWKRDLSVSHNKLGDVAVAEGDLPAARKAYEDSLAIRKDLSARDPANTGWKRDLSYTYTTLGDLAESEGDLPGAISMHERSLPIDEMLAEKDKTNVMFQRDVEVTRRNLERLRAKLG